MKKIIFFLSFFAVYMAAYSQLGNIPYSIQFRGPYGSSVNSGKSYLYVNSTTGNLRADGVPDNEDSGYDWYFIPVGGDEPSWYYIKNGDGKYLWNDKSSIKVGDLVQNETFKWRFFKINMVQQYEPEHSFRLVQETDGKACHITRASNTFITTANSFTSNQNTLYIKPRGQYNIYNYDMELVSNYEMYKLNSSISLEPAFFSEPVSGQTIINEYYFPVNFKRSENSKASLMYNSSNEGNCESKYFIRLKKEDGIKVNFIHPEKESVFYKVNVRIRSSHKVSSPASIYFFDAGKEDFIEKPLFVTNTEDWFLYSLYINLREFSPDITLEIRASLESENDYIDMDHIFIEEIESIPNSYQPFLPGEFNEDGQPMYNYPYENPAFTYTVRTNVHAMNEKEHLFIPFHFYEEVNNMQVSVDRINHSHVPSHPMNTICTNDKGIYLLEKDLFLPGNEYSLTFSAELGNEVFTQQVNLRVVPEKVFWNPVESKHTPSWNDDFNWKDEDGNNAFVPMKGTSAVLPEDRLIYPLINPSEQSVRNSFIHYDYNYQPNTCDTIFFMPGSELGNPFYLNYEQARIEWELNTMQWYNISPPLKNMYSGDFLFERLNPLSELQMHSTENPQTGFSWSDWTNSFHNTTIPLNPGQGYSLRVGSLYYGLVTDLGADYSTKTSIDKIKYQFPTEHLSFRFFDETTKMPSEKIEYLPNNGRQFSHRFIYETIDNDIPVVASENLLLTIETNKEGEVSVVVGNPFMSHFDFADFYSHNHEFIYPQYKILDQEGKYITVLGIDEDSDGIIERYVFTDNSSLDDISIGPFQSFVVTTRDLYEGQPLLITKSMSCLKSEEELKNKKGEALSIYLESSEGGLSEVLLFDSESRINSRKMITENVEKPSHLFFISDAAFYDIGYIDIYAEEIKLGITAEEAGFNKLVVKNLSLLNGRNYFFYDAETQTKIPLTNNDSIYYSFWNTAGTILDRFSIRMDNPFSSLQENFYTDHIIMTMNNNKIVLHSDLHDPIEDILIRAIDGSTINTYPDINKNEFEIISDKIIKNTFYLITVKTKSNIKTFKTLLK